jgi:uncharacterized phiE125 gp8 family phage protein
MTTRLITPPASEPVTLAEATLQLRVDTTDEDTLIAGFIKAAREHAEQIMRRSIMPQTWEKTLDKFPEQKIELLNPSIIAVESVKYIDSTGAEITLATDSYYLDKDSEPGYLYLANGYEWPETAEVANAVRVRYTAGYANAAAVPEAIKVWILLAVEHIYDRCKDGGNASLENTFFKHLLDRYVVWG